MCHCRARTAELVNWLGKGKRSSLPSYFGVDHTKVYPLEVTTEWKAGMIHPGLAALIEWDREEYAAGYRARFSDIPDSEAAHHCWRCGWEDADTEALESARHKKALLEGRPDRFEDTWGNLFDTGEDARATTSV